MLDVKNVSVVAGGAKIVDDVSFTARAGQWLMLCGPNGAGKSTLVKAISRGVKYTGGIYVMGKNARSYSHAELARNVGVLNQHNSTAYAFTVREIAEMGRYAHSRGVFSRGDSDGRHIVDDALNAVGMYEKRDRNILTLSGGEAQRAFLAQVIAQGSRIMLLDEPANHLDLIYQKQLFEYIEKWLSQGGRAVVSVVHDLSLARYFGTHAVLMDGGACRAKGEIKHALARETLESVYGMDVYKWMGELLGQWK